MKGWIKIGVLAALIGAAGAGFYYWKKQSEAKTAKPAAATTEKVSRGTIEQSVSSTGRVVSNLDVDIKCRASGQVMKLPFDVSDAVKAGDLLLEVDPADQQRQVQLAEVKLSASQAKLAQSKQDLLIAEQNVTTARDRANAALAAAQIRARDAQTKADRRRQLIEQKLGSQEDYDAAVTEAAQAEAALDTAKVEVDQVRIQELGIESKRQDVALADSDVKSNQISLDNAKLQLSYTTVTSPIDGVVAARNTQIGTIISSGVTNVGGGTTVLTISDLSHIFILASVDESDIGGVDEDQDAVITADAFPGKRFQGKVVRIATKGVNTSNVVTFEVKIEVTSENKRMLKPEMTANVRIIAARREDVLVAPVQAVLRKQGKQYATVVGPDGAQTEKEVKIGLGDGDRWEIQSGLEEGDTLLVRANEAQSKWRADQGGRPPMMPGMGFPGGGGRGGGGGGRGR